MDDSNVVVVIQDESIYRSNEYNIFFGKLIAQERKLIMCYGVKEWGIYRTMVSGFITIDGFLSFTDEEMALINAESAKKNPPLPPISLAARILNVDVGGIFGSKDALTFTYIYLVQLWNAERRILGFRAIENGSTNQ